MKRTWNFDPLRCPRCSARMNFIAVITQPSVARAILEMTQAIKTRLAEIAQSNQEEKKPAAVAKVR